jgi:hypothetical protein
MKRLRPERGDGGPAEAPARLRQGYGGGGAPRAVRKEDTAVRIILGALCALTALSIPVRAQQGKR